MFVHLFYQLIYFISNFSFSPIFVFRVLLIMMDLMNYHVNDDIIYNGWHGQNNIFFRFALLRRRTVSIAYRQELVRCHATCKVAEPENQKGPHGRIGQKESDQLPELNACCKMRVLCHGTSDTPLLLYIYQKVKSSRFSFQTISQVKDGKQHGSLSFFDFPRVTLAVQLPRKFKEGIKRKSMTERLSRINYGQHP